MDFKIDAKSLGKRLRAARKKIKMTQGTLAELIDVDPAYISRIETGKSIPSLRRLVLMAKILKTTPDRLLKESLTEEISGFSDLSKDEIDFRQDMIVSLEGLFEEYEIKRKKKEK